MHTGIDVILELCEVTSRTVRMMEDTVSRSGFDQEKDKCLSICLCIFSSLIGLQVDAPESALWGGDYIYKDKLFKLLKDYDVIRSLTWQVSVSMGEAGAAGRVEESQSSFGMVQLALALLTKVAVVGDSEMLTLLIDSEVSLILPKRFSFTPYSANSFPMRGYVQVNGSQFASAGMRTFQKRQYSGATRGRDDPEHVIWRASMEFLAAALRSVTSKECATSTTQQNVDFVLS